ncbi:hypothetical protein J6590_099016, partial [Homalodisca vitripennis]
MEAYSKFTLIAAPRRSTEQGTNYAYDLINITKVKTLQRVQSRQQARTQTEVFGECYGAQALSGPRQSRHTCTEVGG